MKKVLFVASVTVHINSFHIPYLKMFKENGYEVHVASYGEENIEYCDKHFNLNFARNPLKLQNLKVYKELKEIIKKENYEIIHCHTPTASVLTRLAAKSSRRNGTRVIYTAHGFHFYKGAPILNWLIYYPIEKWMSKYTDTLITINEEDYKLAKNKFKKIKSIEYVNGVGLERSKFDFEMSKAERDKLRRQLEINDEDFVIIYVAELSKRKNQGMLIRAVKKIIEEGELIKVLLIGSDSMNGYYQKMVKKLLMEDNIKFLGYRKDVPNLMKISNLYISTSKQEGLPVNIIEAMECGLPIIANNSRGNNDLIINAENGYIVSSENELIEKINILKKDTKTVEFMKQKNMSKVEKYLLNTVKENMKEIYEMNQIK